MRTFKTESKKLLDLMINSIYTNREIFLRELISNASDAVDKLYFRSLTDQSIAVEKDDLAIRITLDREARTITVSDNGIGMTAEDLDLNLGTIAHSDSQAFKADNADAQGGDVDIIGQFGVGFYSSFMVASKVRVVSKAFGSDEANAWECEGLDGYTIEPAQRATHGTDVILTIKPTEKGEDADDYDSFLTDYTIEELVKRYSDYVRYPIKMEQVRSVMKERPEDAGADYKPEWENIVEDKVLNSMIPIWKRNKSEITDEEYAEYYMTTFHDFVAPARTISFHAEGSLEYDVLMFIPAHVPDSMRSRDFKKGLALYSSNVLITDACAELIPDCFSFVRGVVDSQDLTLNISRETLQQNSQLRAIARRVEKKIKSELDLMLKSDRETYEQVFEDFGDALKFGIYRSFGEKKEMLQDLLLFYSAKQEKMITLAEYVEAMPEDQKEIYFASGTERDSVVKMPVVTSVLAHDFDVLICTQAIDEFCLSAMMDYQDKALRNVAMGDLDLETEEDKNAAEEISNDNSALLEAMKTALEGKVDKVAVSARTLEAPAVLIAEGFVSLGMEQVLNVEMGRDDVQAHRVLELNPKHTVFETLKEAQDLGQAEKVEEYAKLLYNASLMLAGLPADDPLWFAQAVAKLM